MIIIKNYKTNIKRFKRKLYFDENTNGIKNHYKLYPNTEESFCKPKEKKIVFSDFFHLSDADYTKKEMIDTFIKMNKILSHNYKKIDLRYYKSIFDYIVDIGVQKIRNKAKVMSDLDREFNKSMQYGWQETFKFKEKRKNRKILTFDVNSQYPDAMTKANYTMLDKMLVDIEPDNLDKYTNGQVLVDFDIIDPWFKDIFPRYGYYDGVRYYNTKDKITNLWINIDEFRMYMKYVKVNKIHKVIYSKVAVEHYLSNTIRHFYDLRMKAEKGSLIEKIMKNILVGLHSVTNGRTNRDYSKTFKNSEEMLEFLEEMNISIDDISKIKNVDNNSFKVNSVFEKDSNLILEYSEFDHANRSVINSLCSTIFANSRIKIFQFIELLKENNIDFDLCYINIDSIHISIPKNTRDSVMELLNKNNVIGKELGQWKLEAEADTGMWFEPGRYWLVENNKLVKAANIVIYDGTEKSYLKETRRIKYIDEFGYEVQTPHYVFLGFVSKNIVKNDFVRVPIITLDDRIDITNIKKSSFKQLKHSLKKRQYN